MYLVANFAGVRKCSSHLTHFQEIMGYEFPPQEQSGLKTDNYGFTIGKEKLKRILSVYSVFIRVQSKQIRSLTNL